MYVICVYNNIVHFLAPVQQQSSQTNCFILTAGEPYLACICFMYQPKVLKILLHCHTQMTGHPQVHHKCSVPAH